VERLLLSNELVEMAHGEKEKKTKRADRREKFSWFVLRNHRRDQKHRGGRNELKESKKKRGREIQCV